MSVVGRVLALLCLAGVAGCTAPAPPQKPLPRVVVQVVEPRPDAVSVLLTGDVQARSVSQLSFRAAGKVLEFFVDVGDMVTAGQVLARLDPVEQKAALDLSEVEVQTLATRATLARADYQRQQRLMPNGYTNRNDFERAQAALESAQAELMTATARRQVFRNSLADAKLVAVADGLIVARSIEPGEVVQAGQSVLSLAHAGARDAVFDLYEGIPAMAGVGTSIQLHGLEAPALEVTGHVREVAPMLSPGSGTLRMRMTLPATAPPWPLGTNVVARLSLPLQAAVSLPWAALTRDGERPAVWRLDDQQRAQLTVVEIAQFEAGQVLLASGLAPGDHVVARGGQLLYPGQRVQVAAVLNAPDKSVEP